MPLNLSLLVAGETAATDSADPPLNSHDQPASLAPWLVAGWPQTAPAAEQKLANAESGYQLLRKLIHAGRDESNSSAEIQDATTAALTAAMDGLDANPLRWRADPVSLILDRDQLVVLPGKLADLTVVEAEQLVALLNSHFADDFIIEIGAAHRWYLTPNQSLEITTTSLDAAGGGSADLSRPGGADAMRLQQWLNEIQMALHTAPGNQTREQHDQLVINSLWVWGNNAAQQPPDEQLNGLTLNPGLSMPVVDLVIADSGFAAALAESGGVPWLALPQADQFTQQLPPHGEVIVDLAQVDGGRLADSQQVQAWCEQLGPLIGTRVDRVDIYAINRDGWRLRRWRGADFHWSGRLLARLKTVMGRGP